MPSSSFSYSVYHLRRAEEKLDTYKLLWEELSICKSQEVFKPLNLIFISMFDFLCFGKHERQHDLMAKSLSAGTSLPRFKSQLCYF